MRCINLGALRYSLTRAIALQDRISAAAEPARPLSSNQAMMNTVRMTHGWLERVDRSGTERYGVGSFFDLLAWTGSVVRKSSLTTPKAVAGGG